MPYRWIPSVISVVVAGAALAGVVMWAERLSANRASGPDANGLLFDGEPGVVVAELFTSEGCSSCPPADLVLSQLIEGGAGRTLVLGLAEHVDYWDRLGWRDTFSSAAFSRRQSDYRERVFRDSDVYTPQLVVDGRFEAIGSDRAAVRRVITDAARAAKAPIRVSASPADPRSITARVAVEVPSVVAGAEDTELVVALTQDRVVTDVQRGENRGRRLLHNGVVRSLTVVSRLAPSARRLDTSVSLRREPEWITGDLKVVAFLQERQRRRVVGAGWARVSVP